MNPFGKSVVTMWQDEMCSTSICAFARHIDPRQYPTVAWVDDATPASVMALYRSLGVQTVDPFNSTGFPPPHPSWPIPYGFAKLLLWGMWQYEKVLLFDPDVFLRASPWYFFDTYALPKANSLAIRDGHTYKFNTGVMVLRPNVALFTKLVQLYQQDFVGRQFKPGCGDDQCWLEAHKAVFTIKRMDPCDNNKPSTGLAASLHEACRIHKPGGVRAWHYLPSSLVGWFHELKNQVANGTCRREH